MVDCIQGLTLHSSAQPFCAVSVCIDYFARPEMFTSCSDFKNIPARRPDIVTIEEGQEKACLFEGGWCFHSCLEEAYLPKLLKDHTFTESMCLQVARGLSESLASQRLKQHIWLLLVSQVTRSDMLRAYLYNYG